MAAAACNSWSGMPADLLPSIFQQFTKARCQPADCSSRQALAAIRLACSSWRAAVDDVLERVDITQCPTQSLQRLPHLWPALRCLTYSHPGNCHATVTACCVEQILNLAADLPRLVHLHVDGGSCQAINTTQVQLVLPKLSCLTQLQLSNTQLDQVPDAVTNLISIQTLNLASNPCLTSLPRGLTALTTITSLDLSHCKLSISHLDAYISSLTNLQFLNISANRLNPSGHPPPEILSLPNLRSLTFVSCYFCSLPSVPSPSQHLTSIEAPCNNLRTLPPTFSQITSLRSLNLAFNSFHTFPTQLLPLTCLTHLDLSFNLIMILPQAITALTSLHTLNLSHNRIFVPPTSLPPIPNISLSGNPIPGHPSPQGCQEPGDL